MAKTSDMILGLSHVGLTIRDSSRSTDYYKTLGFEILSDAERKGQAVERITAIPGFHTRTIYFSITQRQHLELFQFFNPMSPTGVTENGLEEGILYVAIANRGMHIPSVKLREDSLDSLVEAVENQPSNKSILLMLQDPDGLMLCVHQQEDTSEGGLMYAALIVEDLEKSIDFYQECLGLQECNRGECETRLLPNASIRWVILQAVYGECLKLIQLRRQRVTHYQSWRMERVGYTHVALAAHDLDRYYSITSRRGVHFKSEPQNIGVGPHSGGKIVYMDTPDGIALELIDSPLVQKQWSIGRK